MPASCQKVLFCLIQFQPQYVQNEISGQKQPLLPLLTDHGQRVLKYIYCVCHFVSFAIVSVAQVLWLALLGRRVYKVLIWTLVTDYMPPTRMNGSLADSKLVQTSDDLMEEVFAGKDWKLSFGGQVSLRFRCAT